MRLKATLLVACLLALVGVVSAGYAIEPTGGYNDRNRERVYIEREPNRYPPLTVDVWTNKGEGAVYYPGERIRVYFRASRDCYVIIYNIDTQGYVHLLFPVGAGGNHFVMGDRPYLLPPRGSAYDLVVSGPSGIEYIEAIASEEPFERGLPWYLDSEYGDWTESPWDLYGSDYEDYADNYDYYYDRGIVRGDPFLAIESINRRAIPPDYPASDYATAYASYYVDRRVEFPRYVCYDCHWDYPGFDPYRSGCVVFDVRIDRTWVYSPRIVLRDYRPRYYYSVRSSAPPRYRGERHFWSSKDGIVTLRKEFSAAAPKYKTGEPGYPPAGKEGWGSMGPSDLRKWKSGRPSPQKTLELRQRLESEGLLSPKQRVPRPNEPGQYPVHEKEYQQKGGQPGQPGQPGMPRSFEESRKELERKQSQQQLEQKQNERRTYERTWQQGSKAEQQKAREREKAASKAKVKEERKAKDDARAKAKEEKKAKEQQKQDEEKKKEEQKKGNTQKGWFKR